MDVVSGILLVVGAIWFLLSAVGVTRLPDALGRVHAATKATTLGLVLVLAGAALRLPAADAAKLTLAMGLVLLTNPLAGHLLGRAVERNPGTAEVRIDVRAPLDEDGGG